MRTALAKRLTAEPIPVAYAKVIDPNNPGLVYDVRLTDVYAEGMEFLEQDARPSRPIYAEARIAKRMYDDRRGTKK